MNIGNSFRAKRSYLASATIFSAVPAPAEPFRTKKNKTKWRNEARNDGTRQGMAGEKTENLHTTQIFIGLSN